MNDNLIKQGKRIPSEVIIEGILLDCMSKAECKYSDISKSIEALRYFKRLKTNQESELMKFFLLNVNDFFEDSQEENISKSDYEFYIRKLFELNIPAYEKIKVIFQGLRFHILNEEQSKDLLQDFKLVATFNKCVEDFESNLMK